jgi:predicted MPP superfamily phosphohydrolase
LGISVVQLILLIAHMFIFQTWAFFWPALNPETVTALRVCMIVLSFTFVPAAILSFRHTNPVLRVYYSAAALWLGLLNFLFLAAIVTWPTWLVCRIAGVADAPLRPWISGSLTLLALFATIFGILNARWIRIRRQAIKLPNLPECWRGRRAVLMTDLHLGNVNGLRFSRRMARLASQLRPDIVFLPGDLFDGVQGDLDALLKPFTELKPPLGIYFSTGNHEEFGDVTHYIGPIARAGIRVLDNESVTIDGVHIAGVSYRDSIFPPRIRSLLNEMHLNSGYPSILLHHVPSKLPIAEQAGISLQLSGHTHGGQAFPFTWFTRRIFGKYTHGLHTFGAMQVYTSTGAGTWGPPIRVGTQPEIVALEFE